MLLCSECYGKGLHVKAYKLSIVQGVDRRIIITLHGVAWNRQYCSYSHYINMKRTNIQFNEAFTVVRTTSATAKQITFHRILSGSSMVEFVLSCKRRPAHARPSHVVVMMDVSNRMTSDHNPLAQALFHSISFVSLLWSQWFSVTEPRVRFSVVRNQSHDLMHKACV
jgi:hypothetical protein